MNIATKTLSQLDAAVIMGSPTLIRLNHDALLSQLRGKGEAPAWDLFPRGRDYFTQRS